MYDCESLPRLYLIYTLLSGYVRIHFKNDTG